MSHITKVEVEITDLAALRAAAERLGLVWHEGKLTYRWYGHYMGDSALPEGVSVADLGKCDHAIGIEGMPVYGRNPYEVGVKLNPITGGYSLLYDFWQGGFGLEAAVGAGCSLLLDEYALQVAESTARNLGWYCEREAEVLRIHHPDGGIINVEKGGIVDCAGFTGGGCVSAAESIVKALGSKADQNLKAEAFQSDQWLINNE